MNYKIGNKFIWLKKDSKYKKNNYIFDKGLCNKIGKVMLFRDSIVETMGKDFKNDVVFDDFVKRDIFRFC